MHAKSMAMTLLRFIKATANVVSDHSDTCGLGVNKITLISIFVSSHFISALPSPTPPPPKKKKKKI